MRRRDVLVAAMIACLCLSCSAPTSTDQGQAEGGQEARQEARLSGLDLSAVRQLQPGEGATAPIRYTLSAPAVVRLRVVDGDTPGIILRTLLDWQPRQAGEQAELWDGLDAKGEAVNPRQVAFHFALKPLAGELSPEQKQALAASENAALRHELHPPESCADLDVRLLSPLPGAELRGTVSVVAGLGERQGMAEGEYHVVIYLDGREVWDGRVPEGRVERSWDTGNVPNGRHLLAVTFNDLHDHAGSDWLAVVVDNR